MPFDLQPVETQKASEAIYDQIKNLIISGRLKPGDRLPSERSMMDMLRRSRPTIREALRMLERAGLIKTMPGSGGAIVQELSTKTVAQPLEYMLQAGQITKAELLEYRRLNDVMFSGWAAERRTDADIAAFEENLAGMERCLDDVDAFLKYDVQFHRLIASAGKNNFAIIIASVISSAVFSLLKTDFADVEEKRGRSLRAGVSETHRRIFEAIRLRDAEGAKSAMREHMLGFETDFKK